MKRKADSVLPRADENSTASPGVRMSRDDWFDCGYFKEKLDGSDMDHIYVVRGRKK